MSILFIIGLILSAVIGLSLGLIGGGGSILTVPILVYLLGVGPHEAVGMSLAVVGATSILGSYHALAAGECRYFYGAAFWCRRDHWSFVRFAVDENGFARRSSADIWSIDARGCSFDDMAAESCDQTNRRTNRIRFRASLPDWVSEY